jgi:hypothetical protein
VTTRIVSVVSTVSKRIGLCLLWFTSWPAWAAAPVLYSQPAYESPVRGDPDDLLLLAGDGLAVNDTVVYQSVSNTTQMPAHPATVPTT